MTPDELIALADAAKPGPWTSQTIEERYNEVLVVEDAQEQLHALAPDLARLCAEMAEALDEALSSLEFATSVHGNLGSRDRAIAHTRAALARLSELESA